ncbi:MAG TPA: hypothetical protein DDX71_07185 [Ruminococcus sp.]|nr:hypothetical protein [Ruminococcus sp.]
MQNLMTKIRVFFEALFLWLGGVCFFALSAMYLYGYAYDLWGIRGGRWFYAVLILLDALIVLWIMIARRRELGDRISTPLYIILHIITAALTGALLLMYIASLGG